MWYRYIHISFDTIILCVYVVTVTRDSKNAKYAVVKEEKLLFQRHIQEKWPIQWNFVEDNQHGLISSVSRTTIIIIIIYK